MGELTPSTPLKIDALPDMRFEAWYLMEIGKKAYWDLDAQCYKPDDAKIRYTAWCAMRDMRDARASDAKTKLSIEQVFALLENHPELKDRIALVYTDNGRRRPTSLAVRFAHAVQDYISR